MNETCKKIGDIQDSLKRRCNKYDEQEGGEWEEREDEVEGLQGDGRDVATLYEQI